MDGRRFGVWSEGFVVDDAGHLIHTYQVNVPGPDSESPVDGWPLFQPVLVKVCEEQHVIDTCMTLRLSMPLEFRDAGETLMSDPQEARVSREWITAERLNDADDMAMARLRDAEANRGSELVGSSLKSTTNEVKSRRSRRSTVDRGGSGWLWCAAIMPTTDDEWERLCSDLPAGHDHYWSFRSPRMFARALGLMVVDQLGPRGQATKLTHDGASEVTHHKGQVVFHGPVAYVEDTYGYVDESATDLERLLRPLFVKRLEYRHQREYRFAVWDEGEQEEAPTLLNTSPALLESTRGLASGPLPVPRSAAAPRTPPPAPTPLPLGSSAAPASDPLTDSFFDLLDNPHVGHTVRTIPPEDAPADLQEKTVIYPAVETLRRIVGKVDNEPTAAAAAWHAEPYIRCLCSRFKDPIQGIRLLPDNFIVIEVKFPEDSDAYGKIAIGPHGVVRHKIGRGREHTDSTSGKTPHEGWPYLDSFERQLEEYGLPVRHDLAPLEAPPLGGEAPAAPQEQRGQQPDPRRRLEVPTANPQSDSKTRLRRSVMFKWAAFAADAVVVLGAIYAIRRWKPFKWWLTLGYWFNAQTWGARDHPISFVQPSCWSRVLPEPVCQSSGFVLLVDGSAAARLGRGQGSAGSQTG